MQRHIEIRITQEKGAGTPVLDYLVSRFTYLDRDGWQQQLAAGNLLVNGSPAQTDETLRAQDLILFSPKGILEPAVNAAYHILHEDDDLLVINKPGCLPCHPRGRYFNNTLWALLKERFGDQYLALVNRLDRETSGIVLLAKNRSAAAICQNQFIARTVNKRYLTIVRGELTAPIEATGFLEKDTFSQVRHKMRFTLSHAMPGAELAGKHCHTTFYPRHHTPDYCLIEAKPHSGRQHQIRATLLALGRPIVGDKIYGGDDTLFLRFVDDRLTDADRCFLVLPRQALHAAELSLRHPSTNEKISFRAPLPPDMAALVPDWQTDSPEQPALSP